MDPLSFLAYDTIPNCKPPIVGNTTEAKASAKEAERRQQTRKVTLSYNVNDKCVPKYVWLAMCRA